MSSLPRDLVWRASSGTLNTTHLINATQTPLDLLLVQQSDDVERQMLLMAGGLALRQRTGYVAAITPQTTHYRMPRDRRPLCSRRALTFLYALSEPGPMSIPERYVELLFREWLLTVNARGERPAEEALPALLDMGHYLERQRYGIRSLTGDRGCWLAQTSHIEVWQWVCDRIEKPQDITIPDSLRDRARQQRGTFIAFLRELVQYYPIPPDTTLINGLLAWLRVFRREEGPLNQKDRTVLLVCIPVLGGLPLSYQGDVLRILRYRSKRVYQTERDQHWQHIATEVAYLFDVRQRMLDAIHKRR